MAADVKTRRSDCSIANTLDIVGDKWTLLIVRDLLFRDDLRFADLASADEAIPTNTLAARLRHLEDAGIIQRTQYSDRPPRHSYRLTDRGRSLGERDVERRREPLALRRQRVPAVGEVPREDAEAGAA